jgi:hypothetical protein
MKTLPAAGWVCAGASALVLLSGCGSEPDPATGGAGGQQSAEGGAGGGGGQGGGGAGGDCTAFCEPAELTYDDDSLDEVAAPSETVPGGLIATRFTPPGYPATLTGARFFVALDGVPTTEFGVRVLAVDPDGEPGADLMTSPVTGYASAGDEWVSVDLSAAGVVIPEGEFFVAMEWLTPVGADFESAQFVGLDRTEPDGRTKIFFASTAKWFDMIEISPKIDRDAMIRAVVAPR